MIKDVKGVKFFITEPKEIVQRVQYRGEFYEQEMLDYIKSNYGKKGTIIDAGASIGNHTVFFSKIAESVYSFEPLQSVFLHQMKNIHLNKITNVKSYNCALGNENTVIGMHVGDLKTNLGDAWVGGSDEYVMMFKLDSFKIKNVKVIKIDVEGHEIELLKGAKNTINKYKPDMFIEARTKEEKQRLDEYIKIIGYKYSGKRFNQTPTYLYKPNNQKRGGENNAG